MYTSDVGGAEILPCLPPSATSGVVVLPRVVRAGDAVFSTNSGAIVKLLKQKGVEARQLEVDERVLYRDERGLTWLGPILFVAAAAYTTDPNVVSVTLGIVANYLTDLFQGSSADVEVKLEIIAEVNADREYCRITYEGSPQGLKELSAVVDSAMGNDPKSVDP